MRMEKVEIAQYSEAERRKSRKTARGETEPSIEGLEFHIKKELGEDLYLFMKKKIEEDALYNYEIANILNVSSRFIARLKETFNLNNTRERFARRFERTYGEGAVEKFKTMIESPDYSLSDVGREFGFSRQYAWHVYQKIYGRPYSEVYTKKRHARKKRRLDEKRKKSKRMKTLMSVRGKLKSIGLASDIICRQRTCMLFSSGLKIALKVSSRPAWINDKQYFHFNNVGCAVEDCDYFICLCRDNHKNIHYIIPKDAMPKSSLALLNSADPRESKYAKFREAWHLLAGTSLS